MNTAYFITSYDNTFVSTIDGRRAYSNTHTPPAAQYAYMLIGNGRSHNEFTYEWSTW